MNVNVEGVADSDPATRRGGRATRQYQRRKCQPPPGRGMPEAVRAAHSKLLCFRDLGSSPYRSPKSPEHIVGLCDSAHCTRSPSGSSSQPIPSLIVKGDDYVVSNPIDQRSDKFQPFFHFPCGDHLCIVATSSDKHTLLKPKVENVINCVSQD